MKRVVPHRSSRPSVGALTDVDTSSSENSEFSQYNKETKKKLKEMEEDDSDIDMDYKPKTEKKETYSDDTSDASITSAKNLAKTKSISKNKNKIVVSSAICSDSSQDSDIGDCLARTSNDLTDTSIDKNLPKRALKKAKPHFDNGNMNDLRHFPHILSKVLLVPSRGGRLVNKKKQLLDLIKSFADTGEVDTALKLFGKFLQRSAIFVIPENHGITNTKIYQEISERVVTLIRMNVGSELLGEAMKQIYLAVSSWNVQNSWGLTQTHFMTALLTEFLLDTGNIRWLCDIMKDCSHVGGKRRNKKEGVAVRTARAVSMMLQDLGQAGGMDDDVRSVSGMSMTSSLAPETVMADFGPEVEACEDGSMDWIVGFYAGFINEKKGTQAAREILEKYRDKNVHCFSSHQFLLDFLEKNGETIRILECLRKMANEFPWHSKIFDYCDLLLKEKPTVVNNDSEEDMEEQFSEMDEISDDEVTNHSKTKETKIDLDKDAKYFEVVERLVNLLDYPEHEDSLKIWGLLVDSLRRLYPDENIDDKMEDLFKTRFPWWFEKNFSVDLMEDFTDNKLNVIAKKIIAAAYLVGTDCLEFSSGLAILEMKESSWKNEVFAYVDTIGDPLLSKKQTQKTNFDKEINAEWNFIKTMKDKQKDLLDADKEADLEQDEMRDEDASNTTNDTIVYHVSSGGNFYTLNEDLKIVQFIAETKRFEEVGGNTLWKLMEDRNVVPNRSWQSLKERFRKVIMKNIDQFEMADYVRAAFLGIGGKKNEKQNKKSK